MGDGLYLKANGELPCWCHAGETHVLDQVDAAWLGRPDADLVGHPALLSVRRALRDGELPFPDLCRRCPALGERPLPALRPSHLDQLLVEPSYLCGLDCPACLAPKQRFRRSQTVVRDVSRTRPRRSGSPTDRMGDHPIGLIQDGRSQGGASAKRPSRKSTKTRTLSGT